MCRLLLGAAVAYDAHGAGSSIAGSCVLGTCRTNLAKRMAKLLFPSLSVIQSFLFLKFLNSLKVSTVFNCSVRFS
jgi:hypothetical protein